MKIVIFNGPPGSGKDTSADHLVAKYGYTKLEMKGALRRLAHAMASLSMHQHAVDICTQLEFGCDPDDETIRLKDTEVRPEFGNRTWRQFLIWISEEVCKPIFGADIFSLAAVKSIRESQSDKITFSDCGFPIEIETVYRLTQPSTVHLFHLYRPGYTYESAGDSRTYVEHPNPEQSPIVLWNESGTYQLTNELDVLMKGISDDV